MTTTPDPVVRSLDHPGVAPPCGCGCGQPVNRYTKNDPKRGKSRGDFAGFLRGHFSRTAAFRKLMKDVPIDSTRRAGSRNGNWSGGRTIDDQGYVRVRVGVAETIREHRLIAEKALGRPLDDREVVHHKNGDRTDNRPENLEVLPSQSEHMRLHMTSERAAEMARAGYEKRRAAALAAAGHPVRLELEP